MALISVIIPNYNRATLVGETVENMLRQSLAPHEVIVVDDGSTDDSLQVLHSFKNWITLIQQENQGPGAARNRGLNIASGEFIQFMDSDDLASLNKLEVQAKALVESNADIVYAPWVRVFLEKQTVRLQNIVLQQTPVPGNRDLVTSFLTGWSIIFQHCLFRTSFVKKVGYYRTDMWTCDDSEFFLRMLLQHPKVIFSDASLTLYRLNDYGKVTGSGFTSCRRVEDWAKFLLAAAAQCSVSNSYQNAIKHPKYLTGVWKTLQLLRSLNSQEHSLVQGLDSLLQQSNYLPFWALRSRTGEILGGLQQRLKGHRWPSCYMPGPLTPYQRELIEELGFCLQ